MIALLEAVDLKIGNTGREGERCFQPAAAPPSATGSGDAKKEKIRGILMRRLVFSLSKSFHSNFLLVQFEVLNSSVNLRSFVLRFLEFSKSVFSSRDLYVANAKEAVAAKDKNAAKEFVGASKQFDEVRGFSSFF